MKTAVAILFLVLSVNANAHQKIESGFQVIDPNHSFLKQISSNPSLKAELVVDHVTSLGFELYGSLGLEAMLQAKGIQYSALPQLDSKMAADYPTPEAIIKKMEAVQVQFPKIVSLIEIGKSVQGRPLMFAKITAAPASAPEFKYVANMHGDEIVGRELMVRLIEDLAKGYGKDTRITRLLDSVQIYIMPSMNPDGAQKRVRENANRVDLNRSFPDFTTSDNQNTSGSREPEIQAMMKFQAKHKFLLSANFHGGAEVVNYPYDTSDAIFPLDNLVKNMSLNYAKQVPYIWNSNEFEHGITNGYAWYEVDGGMQDWSYHWHNDLQVTIELTKTKWPSYATVERSYQDNKSALLGYIEEVAKLK